MTMALPEQPLFTIGQVLDELRDEFAELTQSKIRFLESEGLIVPLRTASGYRKFTYDDIERLRFILRVQKEQYWPLSKIREELDAMDRGEVPDREVRSTVRVVPLNLDSDGLPTSATFMGESGRLRLTREQLLDSAGIDDDLLTAIEDFELIRRRPAQKYYDSDDLLVASLVARLASMGVEPRHLRGMRGAADREVALLDGVVPAATRHHPESAQALAELAAIAVSLHTALVRADLRG